MYYGELVKDPADPNFTVHVTDEEFANVIAVNLAGPFYTLRAAIPLFMEAGGGSVVLRDAVVCRGRFPAPVRRPERPAPPSGSLRLMV